MYELRQEYQLPAHIATIEHCKKSNEPAFHSMSVGAGKTINIAFIAKHIAEKGGRVLVLARQGELIDQNSADAWAIQLKNSVFSASLGKRSIFYPVIFGTEGTVQRALDNEFKSLKFSAILIDECFSPDTKVLTEDGEFLISDSRIKEKKIACFDEENGELKFHKPVNVWTNGVRCISRVKLSCGVTISCTKNHKIYSRGSWVSVENLNIGQEITLIDSSSCTITRFFRAAAAAVRMLMLKLVRAAH